MFLVRWPDELDFINQVLAFPLNTLLLMLGAFILFNVFYLIFVIKRFDAGRRHVLPPPARTVGARKVAVFEHGQGDRGMVVEDAARRCT